MSSSSSKNDDTGDKKIINAGDDDTQDTEKVKKQLLLVKSHCTINMAVSILNFTTRGEILKDILGGDYVQVANYLSAWTTSTAAVEFFLNPTIGKLSDNIGRKPFMVLAPYAAIILKTWVLLKPSVLSLTVERIVCDGLRTLSGSTMGSAALADLVPAKDLGKAYSSLWSSMGIAIILSPLVASRLSARGTYFAAIGLAVVQLITDQFYLEETLPEEKKRPFKGFVNPFELFRLFNTTNLLTTASSLLAIQYLMDVKIVADPLMTVVQWVSGFCGFYGDQRQNAAKQFHTQIGMDTGKFGKGELSGLTANLRALMVVFGPLIYSKAYNVGMKRKLPGAPFVAIAAVCMAAELCHRRLVGRVERKDKKQ
eukprot:UC4_evm5s991